MRTWVAKERRNAQILRTMWPFIRAHPGWPFIRRTQQPKHWAFDFSSRVALAGAETDTSLVVRHLDSSWYFEALTSDCNPSAPHFVFWPEIVLRQLENIVRHPQPIAVLVEVRYLDLPR